MRKEENNISSARRRIFLYSESSLNEQSLGKFNILYLTELCLSIGHFNIYTSSIFFDLIYISINKYLK